jgi:hypothetical protein
MSKDINLPDHLQGNDPLCPWNEPDEYFCPVCNSETEVVNGTLICLNDDCDHTEEPEEYEGDY